MKFRSLWPVAVEYGLNGGKGMKQGDAVLIRVPEVARPMLEPLYESVLRNGGNPIVELIPTGLEHRLLAIGSEEQIQYRPDGMLRGRIADINHRIQIISDHKVNEHKDIDPAKRAAHAAAFGPYRALADAKEDAKQYSWTLGLYGTPAMAAEANLSLEAYWEQIVHACYLDDFNPVQRWRETQQEITRIQSTLTSLDMQQLHIEAEGTDLTLTLGPKRRWLGGTVGETEKRSF